MPLLPPRWRLLVLVLAVLTLPIVTGVLWLLLTGWFDVVHGLLPVGGGSLENWRFLWTSVGGRPPLRIPLMNSLIFAGVVATLEVVIASMAGYAIARMAFPGRRGLLGLVLVLHAFPAVSLLIAIFYILRILGSARPGSPPAAT